MENKIGPEFMEKTKYKYADESDQSKGAKQPPLSWPAEEGQRIIDLPDPAAIDMPDYSFRKAVDERRSHRSFSKQSFTLAELAYLLWCTQGVQKVVSATTADGKTAERSFRTVPSAGARHAFETFIMINNVDGLESGLYRYLALEHKLVEVQIDAALARKISNACLEQTWMDMTAATFIWVADVYRMEWRYVQRGYRYMHLDAGHVCQNLYLAAESIASGVCGIAAFDDDAMNDILGLDGVDKFVIYIAAAGKKTSG